MGPTSKGRKKGEERWRKKWEKGREGKEEKRREWKGRKGKERWGGKRRRSPPPIHISGEPHCSQFAFAQPHSSKSAHDPV